MGSDPAGEQFFYFKYHTFCIHVFFKFRFHTTVTWHSKHVSKQDLIEIKFTSSGNSTMVIANRYVLLVVLYSALKALVWREDREQLWCIPIKTT